MRNVSRAIELLVKLSVNEGGELTMELTAPQEKYPPWMFGNRARTYTDRRRLFLDIEEHLTDRIGEFVIEHNISTTEFGK